MVTCYFCHTNNITSALACRACQRALQLPSPKNTYRIVRVLGQGGFGVVYLATDAQGHYWAIKENTETSDSARHQFEYEATILLFLTHPHLVTVVEYFVHQDRQYLVMEYIEGKNLLTWLQDHGAATENQALTWLGQVLEAVAFLHTQRQPVVHRDIKPENILLLPDERTVKLVDFGIMKIGGAGVRTRRAALGVTSGYSPVEQYSQQGQTGPASDVYALGATLYTLLTNQVPPDAPFRTTTETPTLKPPRFYNPRISTRTEQVVMRALAMSVEHRYANAAEMQQALFANARVHVAPVSPTPSAETALTLPEPISGLAIQSDTTQPNRWVNHLQWEPSPTPGARYLVVRKYHQAPQSPTDGDEQAIVSQNRYEDINPTVGVPVFYAIYAYQNGRPSHRSVVRQAQLRTAEVTRLRAVNERGTVRLTWQPPKNVSAIIIRRDPTQYPQFHLDGEAVAVTDLTHTTDKIPRRGTMYYTVFCRFRDKTIPAYIISQGARVKVTA